MCYNGHHDLRTIGDSNYPNYQDIKDVDSMSEYPTINLFGQSEIMNMMPTIITINKCRFQTKFELMLLHHSTYIVSYNNKKIYLGPMIAKVP